VIDDSYFDHQTIPEDGLGMILEIIMEPEFGVSTGENQFDININGTDFKKLFLSFEGIKWLNDLENRRKF
jgi:D-alanyl-D-alanine carboxypeptidase/D-alanyl-D-alanine-endopeptidase (penicillin-binding protein 4)